MKSITINHTLEEQILSTDSQLAVKDGAQIYLVLAIKVGKNRTYVEMANNKNTKTRNLKTLIKKGIEFITPEGNMFVPKYYDEGMFILDDGKKIATGYTPKELVSEHGSFAF